MIGLNLRYLLLITIGMHWFIYFWCGLFLEHIFVCIECYF